MLNFMSSTPAESMADAGPIDSLPIPEMEQGGYAINLIAAVRDHAPARIEEIQKSIREMQAKINQLQVEERLLSRLVAVVTQEA